MFKKLLAIAVIGAGFAVSSAPSTDAAVIVRRIAPVRRVAARAVLPPYPVARRAVVGPIYRPYYAPYRYGGYYGGGWGYRGWGYGPGISIGVGF